MEEWGSKMKTKRGVCPDFKSFSGNNIRHPKWPSAHTYCPLGIGNSWAQKGVLILAKIYAVFLGTT